MPEGEINAPLTAIFAEPLGAAQQRVIERLRVAILGHTFELHDIGPAGEQIYRLPVATYLSNIELGHSDDPRRLTVFFTLRAQAGREVLVWTSSLFFQFIHYHVARVLLINGAPHQMDWEAAQDPQAPARIRRWVEGGTSLIERLHIREQHS